MKSVMGGVTTYYIGNHFEYVNSSTTKKYYYAGGQRVAMRSNGTLYFLLGDHLGSTSVTANSNGTLYTSQRYYPWGGTRAGSSPTSFQYTGQRKDATGLYFYNARYYDPALGRFLAADSIGPDPANPQSLNRYSYTVNNPLKYTDPTGHYHSKGDENDFWGGTVTEQEYTRNAGQHVWADDKPDTLTIFVDQPIEGSPMPFGVNHGTIIDFLLDQTGLKHNDTSVNPGHVFVQLTDGQTGEAYTYGFYPLHEGEGLGKGNSLDQGYVRNDAGHSSDVKKNFSITDEGFEAARDRIMRDAARANLGELQYDLSAYNCTTWVQNIAQTAGIENLPSGFGWWGIGSGANPGTFGEQLRKFPAYN